jgi:hypothetical protein
MTRAVVSALTAILLSSGASAATISYTYAPSTSSLAIQQFDPTLGTLTKATVDVTGELQFPFTDTTPTPTLGTYSYHAFYSLYYFGTFHDYGVNGSGSVTFGLSPTTYLTATGGDTFDIDAFWLPFTIGNGTFLGTTVSDPPSSLSFTGGTIVPNTSIDPIEKTGLTITYTYDAITNGVPEPASWIMMIAGFGFIGATQRRKRRLLRPMA